MYSISRSNMSAAVEQFLKSMSILNDNEYGDVTEIKFNKRIGDWSVYLQVHNERQLELPLGNPLAR
jgi:hypothetical protein